MNLLKDAQSAIEFATYYPLLYKAIADNDTITEGYIYEEIIKLSFISNQHRLNLVDFLLGKLQNYGWPGKQKIVRVLLQLSRKGHCGIRMLLRQRDGEIRNVASQATLTGTKTPLANTPQLFFNSVVQELFEVIFDAALMKADEDALAKGNINSTCEPIRSAVSVQGYGASGNRGKYEGFGNTPTFKQENFIGQVKDVVEKVISTNEAERREEDIAAILKTDKGNYKPFYEPRLTQSISVAEKGPTSVSALGRSSLYMSATSIRSKERVAGKAGGGWASDEEDCPTPALLYRESSPSSETDKSQEDSILIRLSTEYHSWPVDYINLLNLCKECELLNSSYILNCINEKLIILCQEVCHSASIMINLEEPSTDINLLIFLVFIELGMNEGIFSPQILRENILKTLLDISQNTQLHSTSQLKAKKLHLMVQTLIPDK